MPAKVVDASVLAAILFGEPRSREAEALLADADLYAPHLLSYELTSVARRKALRYPKRRHHIEESLALFSRLDIEWVDTDPVTLFSLALETNLTTYDAAYLQVARFLNLPLVTFDTRLAKITGLRS